MIFYYLYDDSRPPGSAPLAACQKGGMHCQKETITGAERLVIAFWVQSSKCGSVYLQAFPALFPYNMLVCRSMGRRQKNWTLSSCLGSCLLMDRKRWGLFCLLLMLNSSGKTKEIRQKGDLTLETTSPNSQPSMSTLGLQILQGEMLNFGSNLETNNFMLSPFANK